MSDRLSRRGFMIRGASLAAVAALPEWLQAQSRAAPAMVVYKDPNCGCCKLWVDHVRAAGFAVATRDTSDIASIKQRYGVPTSLASCHTGVVGGYVVEGHVPADLVQRLLREKPKVTGIAVPGMPSGSPGMEGGPRESYQVLTFNAEGKTTVFATR